MLTTTKQDDPSLTKLTAERRTFSRVKVRLDGVFCNRSIFPSMESGCRLIDLSFGGAQLIVPQTSDNSGDSVEISLPVENKESVLLPAEVVRCQKASDHQVLGVQFKGVPISEQLKLHQALRGFAFHDAQFDHTTPLSPFNKRRRIRGQRVLDA